VDFLDDFLDRFLDFLDPFLREAAVRAIFGFLFYFSLMKRPKDHTKKMGSANKKYQEFLPGDNPQMDEWIKNMKKIQNDSLALEYGENVQCVNCKIRYGRDHIFTWQQFQQPCQYCKTGQWVKVYGWLK
jgi:hypothetical protein